MMDFLSDVREYLIVNKKIVQPVILYGSSIVGMGLAFLTSIWTTRFLSPTEFGNMKFVVTVWTLFGIIVNLGIFHSAGQAILREHQPKAIREIIGADLIIAFAIGIALVAMIVILSKPIDWIFKIQIAELLLLLAPLVIIYPFRDALTLILQCTNKIFLLAVLNALPSLLFLIFLMIASHFLTIGISILLIAMQFSLILVIIFMIIILRPSFANLWKRIKEIMLFQKSYGLPQYIGYLVGNATGQINRLAIVFWVDSASIGFYSLAYTLVEPLRLIPFSVATASFREFAGNKRVPRKILAVTLISTLVTLVVTLLLLGKPLTWVYPAEYAAHIGPMSQILAFGAVIQGFAELFNRFLGAHGRGRQLKIAAYAFGAAYVLGTLVMTPLWGVWGTIGSVLLASSINLGLMLFFYNKDSFGSNVLGE